MRPSMKPTIKLAICGAFIAALILPLSEVC
jgi:hypothetical protein